MPGKSLPDDTILRRWVRDGLKLREMVDLWEKLSNVKATPQGFSTAIKRAGIKNPRSWERMEDELPWHPINPKHRNHYYASQLRKLGRRHKGLSLTPREARRLDSWLAKLDEPWPDAPLGSVIAYKYDSPDGFYWVYRVKEDGDSYARLPEVQAKLDAREARRKAREAARGRWPGAEAG